MMDVIIAQLLLPGASAFERKSQGLDMAALSAEHDVRAGHREGADIIHVYAPRAFDAAALGAIHVPFVSNAHPKASRFAWRKTPRPARILSPLKVAHDLPDPRSSRESAKPQERKHALTTFIPEAVGDQYFEEIEVQSHARATVGTYARPAIRNIVEQTATRIHRFREDVDWLLFDESPAPEDLRSVDVWVDPAIDEEDADGFVAEALAAGIAVVASRTALNSQRLEKGRIGGLVPLHDPNELTHAILAALFKPEWRQSKVLASQQTASKFRVRHRARALIQLYESILQ